MSDFTLYNHVICTGCGTSDSSSFIYDSHSDSLVCTLCGVQCDPMAYDTSCLNLPGNEGPTETLDFDVQMDNLIEGIANKKRKLVSNFKDTYKRRVFITERLSQAIRKEPRIADDHLQVIKDHHALLLSKNPFYAHASKSVNKSVVRTLLRFIDERMAAKAKKDPLDLSVLTDEKRYYCKNYLGNLEFLKCFPEI